MQHLSNISPQVSASADGYHIRLQNAGKRFNRDWIFRNFSYTFTTGCSYAITGPNGSGKSTLLQCIAASIQLSEGTAEYEIANREEKITNREQGIKNAENRATETPKLKTGNKFSDTENVYRHISIAAPYLEVIEEMTATEFLQFHAVFKPLTANITIPEILEISGLKAAANKQVRFYSSGMKQRIKLAQAIFSNAPVLLLDEPCTNLDKNGYALYHKLIKDYCGSKLVIVSSNDINEYNFCLEKISISDYK